MNEIQASEIKQIELEISKFSKELRRNILTIGRLQLGEGATIKQICNHVGPQVGLHPKQCLDIIMHVKEGVK